uniref:Sphingomyelin synthase-like domain-containing protein n=1 Tax=Wuchereria bancrofti TaxID=6293 RepID=A0AAF5PM66_WUCBA
MGGHRRDQSDSHVPLKQSAEFQQCVSSNSQEQIRYLSETSLNIVEPVPNGTISSLSSTDLPIHRNDSIFHRQRRIIEKGTYRGWCDTMMITAMCKQQHSAQIPLAWQKEVLKTFAAFVCLLISAFLNFFLLTVIHDIVPREPLPDLVFMLIPQQRWAWVVGDIFSTLNAVLGFTCVLLHKKRLIVFRRVLLLGGIMYGLRAIVLGLTFLPPSFQNRDEICLPQVNRTAMYATEITTRFVTYVVTLGLTSGQDKILCGDLMFSGHTVVLTIMYFTLLQYTPRRLVYLRYIAAPLTYIGIAALVISGGHYTMDVLIAYWLTSHIFYAYHQVFAMPRVERTKAPLSHLWWFWLCYWFESDVPDGVLRNEWEWPLPGPVCVHHFIQRISDKLQ